MNDKQEKINKILTLDAYDKIEILSPTKHKVDLDSNLLNYLEEKNNDEIDTILRTYFTSAALINCGLF